MVWFIRIKFKLTEIDNNHINSNKIIFIKENIKLSPELLAEINDFVNEDGSIDVCCLRKFNTKCVHQKKNLKEVVSAFIFKSNKYDVIDSMTKLVKKSDPYLSWEDYVFEQKIIREERKRNYVKNQRINNMKKDRTIFLSNDEQFTYL